MKKSLELRKRIADAVREKIDILPYNPEWPSLFEKEKKHLQEKFPCPLIKRIEHFGSTAVPGLASKPIIDILVEVSGLDQTKKSIVPVLESEGYDYFWRPKFNSPSEHYAWFIKRDNNSNRTHHIHMVESDSDLWDRLLFKDYLIKFPEKAKEYEKLKYELAEKFPNDRIAYTQGKTEFIVRITNLARNELL